MINSFKKNNNKIKKFDNKKLLIPILLTTQLSIVLISLFLGGNLYKKGVLSYWKDDILHKYSEYKNNFISFFSSDIPKYKIKLDFLNMRQLQVAKLNAIKNKSTGNFNNSKYVKAILKIDQNPEKYDLKIRLKGTGDNHFRHSSSWSFKVRTKNISPLINNNEFSLQHTRTRSGINEYAFQKLLKQENLFFHRINLVDVILNNQSLGSYFVIDGYSKYLIESNRKREGLIFEYDKSDFVEHLTKDKLIYENFIPKSFQTSQVKTLGNTRPEKFNELRFFGEKQLRSFQSGELSFSDAFEYKDAAKVLAIRALFGSSELDWRDMKFYLNPITMKLELISREIHAPHTGQINIPDNWWYIDPNKPELPGDEANLISQLNGDKLFMKEYINALDYYSNKKFLDNFLDRNQDIFIVDKKINKFVKSKFRKEDIYRNALMIRDELYKKKKLNTYNTIKFSENGKDFIKTSVSNINNFPLEIGCIRTNQKTKYCPEKETIIYPSNNKLKEIKFLKVSDKKNNLNSLENFEMNLNYGLLGLKEYSSLDLSLQNNFETINSDYYDVEDLSESELNFIEVDRNKKVIYFVKENIILNKPLLIPNDYKLIINKSNQKISFANDAFLIIKGNLIIEGKKDYPIIFSTIDNSSGGILIIDGIDKSIIKFAEFYNLSAPKSPYKNLTGAITIYNSNVIISDSRFYKNKNGDDYVNGFRSNIEMKNLFFEDVFADAIDLDFCRGFIDNAKFKNVNNDAIDFSGSEFRIENIYAINIKDKVISAGEKSSIEINNLEAKNSEIVIASKDSSFVKIKNIKSKNNKHIFAAYNKKPEFKGGLISTDIKLNENYSILKDEMSNIIFGEI